MLDALVCAATSRHERCELVQSTPRRAHSTDGGGMVPPAAKAASKAALVHVRSAFAQSKAALQRFSVMAKARVHELAAAPYLASSV